ncbi:8e2b2b98-5ad1-4db7-8fae-1ab69609bf9b [Sclerotinia trifoliorum]|uniref:8e2b2b98-5ad1-4db7-8fae-1ab69609bf9b n=1 Tax=Sclerotinia trifoliorum TaxID=28548 RepID=A0A8H2VW66_9HELO|nr:8e2b2b98-5ad1-4db7-8fae-1ab69609bf9b [Sclerotinia trifoliorum]
MALRTILSAIAVFGAVADAIPSIAYPINAQFPPIARVSLPYSYTFPQSTFSSTSPLRYSLSGSPQWLSVDSTSRTLSGIPSSSDVRTGTVTEITFGVIASDSSGSITSNTTLVVSKNSPPSIKIPAQLQLASQGPFSAPSTLLYHPSSPFEISFDPATFSSSGGTNLKYYALSADDTPLPSWVLFDDRTLTFSGETPEYASLIQPPQTFGIQLIASDVAGYSGASIPFNIRVGVHLLAFSTVNSVVNATPGVEVNYTSLENSLQLDGQPANDSSIVSVTAQTPEWLTFDDNTLSLTGTPPSDAISYNVSVQAVDIYGDNVNTVVFIKIATALFVGPIKDVNATIGSKFSFSLGAYIENTYDTTLTAQVSPPTDWIYFDAHGFVISGKVPTSAKPSNINITLTATSKASKRSSSESFNLAIQALDGGSPTGSDSTPSSLSGASAASGSNHSASKDLSKGEIAAIVVPILIVFIALILCLFYYRKRRSCSSIRSGGPSKEDISGPLKSTSSIERALSAKKIAPLQLDTSGFSIDASSSVYTSTTPNFVVHDNRKSLRRSQTLVPKSQVRESQGSGNRARAYSENALIKTPNGRTNSSNMLRRNYSNYSRKGHTRRSQYVVSNDPRLRDSEMSQLGNQSLLGTNASDGTILNLSDSNFSSSPLDNFSVLSGDWSKAARAPLAPRQNKQGRNTDRRRAHRKSTTRNLNFAMADSLDKRISGLGHGARESISSFDNVPGNRGSIGHGQHPSLVRNSRTWRTVNTIDADADKHRSATSVYSTASTDLLNFGHATVSPTGGKEMKSIKTVPKSPRPPAPIWEQETGGTSRMSYNSINARPVSRRGGVSPFFGGGGMASVRRKARRSYADSPTVPEEVHIGNEVEAAGTGINNDTLGITYPNGYSSAKEGTRQLRSYIQATFSKSRLKGSDSLVSMDSRFESVSNSMQELQIKGDAKSQGDISQSQGRHAQLLEADRREQERGTERGVGQANTETETGSDVFPSEFSAGSWESLGESTDVDSQPNFIRHGAGGTVPQIPQLPALGLGSSGTGTDSGIGARGRSNTLAIPSFSPFLPNPFTPDLGASETQSGYQNPSPRRSTETDLKQNTQRDKNERDREAREESPTIGNLMVGPNARMVMGAGRRPVSVDARENKRISSTKAKIGRHGEGGESVVTLGSLKGSLGGSVGVGSPPQQGKGGGNGMGMGKVMEGEGF